MYKFQKLKKKECRLSIVLMEKTNSLFRKLLGRREGPVENDDRTVDRDRTVDSDEGPRPSISLIGISIKRFIL